MLFEHVSEVLAINLSRASNKNHAEVLVECYLRDLSVSNPCSFWRHGFSKQVLLSRWKYVKCELERPKNQGEVACCLNTRGLIKT